MISEVFCEIDFEDAAAARQQRDLRIAALQAQGLVCLAENLYRVDGRYPQAKRAPAPRMPRSLSAKTRSPGSIDSQI
jgi:hypothetical protein